MTMPLDMTYKQFVAYCQAMQRKHVRTEKRRYEKARRLQRRFVTDMHKLGLHPLDRFEIADHLAGLERMGATVKETHGDSLIMRWSYKHRYKTGEGFAGGLTRA